MQLLRRLRGVHVRPLLRALPGLQVRSHPRPAAVVTRTLDRNAEALNKSGLLCCVLGCFFPCVPALLLRNEARDKYNIEVRPLVEAFSVIKYVSIYATCTRAAPAGTWGRRCAARCACSARWGWRYRTSSREPRHSRHSGTSHFYYLSVRTIQTICLDTGTIFHSVSYALI